MKNVKSGSYSVKAKYTDSKGNIAVSSTSFYVWGDSGTQKLDPSYSIMDIRTSRQNWSTSEKPEILFENPWDTATALVTVESEGLHYWKVHEVKKGMVKLNVPLTNAMIPNAYVGVHLSRGRKGRRLDGAGNDPLQSNFKSGWVKINITPDDKLIVDLKWKERDYTPGSNLDAEISLRNKKGEGVRGEVLVFAVDESVLSLTGYKLPDETSLFREKTNPSFMTDSRKYLSGRISLLYRMKMTQGGGGGDFDEGASANSSMRKNFKNLAFWKTDIVTSADGAAKFSFRLPDNMTTWRIMAFAVDKGMLSGKYSKKLIVRKPFYIREAMPRFLTQGDKSRFGVIARNDTKEDLRITVSAHSDGVKISKPEKTVLLKKGQSVPVKFDVISDNPGDFMVEFRSVALGDTVRERDNVRYKIKVMPAIDWYRSVQYGTLKSNTEVAVRYPEGTVSSGSSLELEVSDSPLSGMSTAFDYLVKYPYGCVEQTTSSTLPLLLMTDLIDALGNNKFTKSQLTEMASKGIDRLSTMRTSSGGLGYWPGDKSPHLFGSSWALHALLEGESRGITLPKGIKNGVITYLQNAVGKATNVEEKIFAAYALSLAGIAYSGIEKLFKESSSLSFYSKLYLLRIILKNKDLYKESINLLNVIESEISEDGKIKKERSEHELIYSSDIQIMALAVQALIEANGNEKKIAGLVKNLILSLKDPGYLSTQGAAHALMALNMYLKLLAPDPRALEKSVVQIDGRTLPISKRKWGSKRIYSFNLKNDLMDGKAHKINIINPGKKGSLIYTLRTRYAKKLLKSQKSELNKGIYLWKIIENDSGQKVNFIKAGERLRVRLYVSIPKGMKYKYLALEDPLFSGIEAVKTNMSAPGWEGESLSGVANLISSDLDRVKYSSNYVNYREFRDDRVVFFINSLSSGFYEFSYIAQATTTGSYTVRGAHISPMYQSEISSRTSLGRFSVK